MRLADAVTAERVRRGYRTRSAFALASGLSLSTLDNIEHGRKQSYDPATLAALEHALGWESGSVVKVLQGLDPKQLEDSDLSALVDAWPRLSSGARRMLRILATEASRAED